MTASDEASNTSEQPSAPQNGSTKPPESKTDPQKKEPVANPDAVMEAARRRIAAFRKAQNLPPVARPAPVIIPTLEPKQATLKTDEAIAFLEAQAKKSQLELLRERIGARSATLRSSGVAIATARTATAAHTAASAALGADFEARYKHEPAGSATPSAAAEAKSSMLTLSQRQPTIKANRRDADVAVPVKSADAGDGAATSKTTGLDSTLPQDSAYFDDRIGSIGPGLSGRRKRRQLVFNEKGKYQKLANNLRVQAKINALKKKVDEAARKTGISSVAHLAALAPKTEAIFDEPIPDVEWWDRVILDKAGYDVDTTTLDLQAIITDLVEHPVQHRPPGESDEPKDEAMKVYLTKEERRKLRRQNRKEVQREKTEKIRLGLEPAPEPKVKISNLMRVLGTEAVQDPTKMEAHVRAQMAKRLQKHEDENMSRKLTDEERKEKARRKYDDKPPDGQNVEVSIYRVADLSHPARKFKVEKNMQQLHMTGIIVLYKNVNVVVAEGGPKQQRFFKKLMLSRIKWADDQIMDEHRKKTGVANKCILVWEGVGEKSAFGDVKFRLCQLEKQAREIFQTAGVEHYWDLAFSSSFVQEEMPTI